MATNFPTSLDNLTNPTSGSALNSPDHAGQHADANDAIEALEAKVGVNGSAVTTSLDYKVTNGVMSALNVDNGVLWVDATNNRVGVNTVTPQYPLDVVGGGYFSGSIQTGGYATTGTSNLGTIDAVGTITAHASSTQDGVKLQGRAGGSSSVNVTLTPTTLTANRTLTLPDATGTVALTSATNGDLVSPYSGFRNAIINGDFRINQRNFSSTTTNATYGFDRWYLEYSGGTSTYSSQSFTVGSPAVTGYEAATFARVVSASQSLSSHYTMLVQRIEDVRTFANAPVTISFWAKASSGTPSVAIELQQNFGSGGSPSAQVNTAVGKVTLSTSWTRYTVSYSAVPSISGKTIGTTANTSFIGLNLWTSAGSTYDSRTGTLGLQSATIDFWGVQVERGSSATPFEQRPIGAELALCQRYYEKSYSQATAPGTATTVGVYLTMGTTDGANNAQQIVRFCVPKRYASYTITAYNSAGTSGYWEYYRSGASSSTATPTLDLFTDNSFRGYVSAGAAYVGVQFYGHWVCNAEF